MYCSITVKGHLDQRWSEWFDGLTITQLETGESVLIGYLADQAALHGVLTKVRDLGLKLVTVECTERERTGRALNEPSSKKGHQAHGN
jgi:hypothetical protein